MTRYLNCFDHANRLAAVAILLAATLSTQTAFALIEGGDGNEPIDDPGWPNGAGIVFNQPGRIAYWEGPPFGGGQWHSECRGDAKLFNAALANFANIDAKTKRLVVHDGVGRSFWLNMNNEPHKAAAAQMDWSFTVWQLANWKQIAKLPPALKPADMGDANNGPPTQIDVYVGGKIKWADVVVPKGVEVIDERLEAHGVSPADGTVLEGTITDLETKKPLAGRVDLQLIDPQKKGGYHYLLLAQTNAGPQGKWKIKNAPAGSVRVVLFADGYVPRVVGYGKYTGEPSWHPLGGSLLRSAKVSGRVVDESQKPLADAEIKLIDFENHGENYQTADDFCTTTDTDGRFHFDNVPIASANIMLHKKCYVLPGLGPTIKIPTADVVFTMKQSAQLHVTVDFTGSKRSQSYIVELEPVGGNVVGSWGGSSQIDDKNQVLFHDAPPGKYFLQGHPNPHQDKELSKRISIELKGGETKDVKLSAK